MAQAGLLDWPVSDRAVERDDAAGEARRAVLRGTVAVVLAIRAIVVLAPLVRGYRPAGLDLVVLAGGLASLAPLALVARRAGRGTPLLLVDLAGVFGLIVLAAVPAGPVAQAYQRGLLLLGAGAVAVQAVAWGALIGACVVAAAVPVQVLAARLGTDLGPTAVPVHTGWLLATLVATLGGAALLIRQTRAAVRRERRRLLRVVHDTALQCLEVMSRPSTMDDEDPAATVARWRAAARAEVTRLRTTLDDGEPTGGGLLAALGAVVADAMARGLRVDLVAGELDGATPSPIRCTALCGATDAALSNVFRHSGVLHAVVRLERDGSGIRVVVRDHGRGFEGTAGFGIRESILARVREVGGEASVSGGPGAGTRVTLWVPA